MNTSNYTAMKKLTNVSPFLLLLVPVFIMMLLTFTAGNINSQNEEVALKSAPAKSSLATAVSPLIK